MVDKPGADPGRELAETFRSETQVREPSVAARRAAEWLVYYCLRAGYVYSQESRVESVSRYLPVLSRLSPDTSPIRQLNGKVGVFVTALAVLIDERVRDNGARSTSVPASPTIDTVVRLAAESAGLEIRLPSDRPSVVVHIAQVGGETIASSRDPSGTNSQPVTLANPPDWTLLPGY